MQPNNEVVLQNKHYLQNGLLNRIKIIHFTITQPLRKVFPLLSCDSIRDFIGTLEVRPHSYTVQYFQ